MKRVLVLTVILAAVFVAAVSTVSQFHPLSGGDQITLRETQIKLTLSYRAPGAYFRHTNGEITPLLDKFYNFEVNAKKAGSHLLTTRAEFPIILDSLDLVGPNLYYLIVFDRVYVAVF